MNKNELVSAVAEKAGLTKADAASAVDAVFETVQNELKSGGDIRLAGFGSFSVSRREASKGRNPSTGAEVDIPARNVPKFSAGKGLKDAAVMPGGGHTVFQVHEEACFDALTPSAGMKRPVFRKSLSGRPVSQPVWCGLKVSIRGCVASIRTHGVSIRGMRINTKARPSWPGFLIHPTGNVMPLSCL
ncbi:hypothetical protein Lal_00010664 [Lupinus albus]|nr:hypothetical protein Lal_00010664 [Lupinus albus]